MAPMTTWKDNEFDRQVFESVLKRRFFFTEAFEIYRQSPNFKGDNRGLFDYGPPGCALQTNIVDVWRRHFVLEENMLELDCTVITPEQVFEISGHVGKFSDWMCKDPIKGQYLRADHLVENVLKARLVRGTRGLTKDSLPLDETTIDEYNNILAKIDNYNGDDLGELIKHHDIRNPENDNQVLPPIPFNLMFKSTVGPSAAAPVYLRPETAQGQFLNFKKLLDYNQGSMPFASASIGKTYRNEISPRTGLLRVREFLLAEIEHYVDPEKKEHPRFCEVTELVLPLLDRETQLSGKTTPRHYTLKEAVRSRIIDNETLGYFLGRIMLFLLKLGVNQTKVRFRQHLANEMAHYATDCWDAELLTSYGWIECVGCADRSAYDLTVHSQYTGTPLIVKETLPNPVRVEEWQATLNKKLAGPRFRENVQTIQSAIEALDQITLERMATELSQNGAVTVNLSTLSDAEATTVELPKELLSISKINRLRSIREYTPNVIEPSFGIGRILYCLLEQVYWHRPNDVARAVLSLPFAVSPTKVLVAPLYASDRQQQDLARRLAAQLRELGIVVTVDASSASIGRRYARADELGTPLAVTVDSDSLREDGNGWSSVTLRERDSTAQVRAPADDIIAAVAALVAGSETWEKIVARMGIYDSREGEVKEK
ncbi:glycyl-tRNA synthetase [Corynascus similis CBS 632.67]